MPNANSAALASRAIGAMFFTVFGTAWIGLWNQRAFGGVVAKLAVIIALGLAILWRAWLQYNQNKSAHEAEAESPEHKQASRIFNIVNVTQWVAILVVGNVLANVGLGAWVLPAAMLIIGLHFFPLAKAFNNPNLNYTGAAMVVLAVGYPFIAPQGAADPVGCLLEGLILWASAVYALMPRDAA